MSVSVSAPVQAFSQVNSLRSSSATNGADSLDSILQMFAGAGGQSPATPPVASANQISPANAFDPGTFNALLSIQEQASAVTPADAAVSAMSKSLDQLGGLLGPLASVAMFALI